MAKGGKAPVASGIRRAVVCDMRMVPRDTSSVSERAFKAAVEERLGFKLDKDWPDWLRNVTTYHMELDMFNAEEHIAIEYNGPQHYVVDGKYNKTINDLQRQQQRDERKAMLCKQHHVQLISVKASCPAQEMLDFFNQYEAGKYK